MSERPEIPVTDDARLCGPIGGGKLPAAVYASIFGYTYSGADREPGEKVENPPVPVQLMLWPEAA